LETARNEIKNLRRIAKEFQTALREEKAADKGPKKREAVLDQGKQIRGGDAYVPKVFEKTEEIRSLLMGVVTSNILFSSYANDEHNAIVDAFEKSTVESGTFVIRQGESGDNFYIVESGTLEIYIKDSTGEPKRVGNVLLSAGMAFGELALMYNTPRAASIKASSDCVLWQIDRNSYRGIVVYYKHMRNKQYMEFLREVEIKGKKLGIIMSESKFLLYRSCLPFAFFFPLTYISPNTQASWKK